MVKQLPISLAILAVTTPLLLMPVSPDIDLRTVYSWVYQLLLPVVAFGALTVLSTKRAVSGLPRYSPRRLCATAAAVFLSLLLPNTWWYFEVGREYRGGGVNFAMALMMLAMPIIIAVVIAGGVIWSERSLSERRTA